jgi:toxin ParE1/3/4
MTKSIVITPRASQDLDDHYAYIAQNNSDAALRFFDATRQTFVKLAQMSGMGSFYPVKNSRLDGLRRLPIKGFENYLIFYLAFVDYLEVVRILHAARDLEEVLSDNEAK